MTKERMTHRKRMVLEAATAVTELYEMGKSAPTIDQVVEQIVDNSVQVAVS